MTDASGGLIQSAFAAVGRGLPELLLQFVVTVALLAIGVRIYMAVTPFRELDLVRRGNAAGGAVLAGAIVALSLPLAAMLATSGRVIDIVVWGVIALAIQLLTMLGVTFVFRHFGTMIESGNVAAALSLAAMQISVGILNAAVMIPT
jgi:putative membrane protein